MVAGAVGDERLPGRARLGIDMGEEEPPLRLAEVLHAATISARDSSPAEVHAADQLEIRHLRHELVLRCRRDPGHSVRNLEPFPARRADRGKRAGEAIPDSGGLRDRRDEHETAAVDCDRRGVAASRQRQRRRRHGSHEPRNGPRRRRPGGAEHCKGSAAIV
jgi:hypothetical protein